MKILLILAIAMAGGLALSRLMKLLNLPNVTGYLIAGILIGPFVLKLVTNVDIKSAKIITTTALGFIAFSIGGEFKLSLLKKLGGKIVVITYLMGMAVRASRMDNKWIPILCGLLGGLLGLGTLICAFCLGPLIQFFNTHVSENVLQYVPTGRQA